MAQISKNNPVIDLDWQGKGKLAKPLHLTSRPSDLWALDEVMYQGSYDLQDDLDEQIDGRPIIDLGANIGVAATYFASRYPNSEVLAVEPHPRNAQHLAINGSRYPNITVLQAAVAAEQAPLSLIICGGVEENYLANRFGAEEGDKPAHGVKVVTPGQINEVLGDPTEIGMLKIDIEGAERDLLASAADILLRKTAVVAIETHERFVPGSEKAVATAMRRNGLAPNDSSDHTDIYIRSNK